MRSRLGPNSGSGFWSEWDPVFAHTLGHGSCLRWGTSFTKPLENIGEYSLSWKAWFRNGVETKSNVVQKSDPTLITTEVGILIKTRSRVVWTLGSEFWPKRGPFLDQAWGQNLYQNEIPFCIKRGVRILIEMRSRFGSNLRSDFLSNWDPVSTKLWFRFSTEVRSQSGSNFLGQNLDQKEIPLWLNLGAKVLIKKRSRSGLRLGVSPPPPPERSQTVTNNVIQ